MPRTWLLPLSVSSVSGTEFENMNHLFLNCFKVRDIWIRINVYLGTNVSARGNIADGGWLNLQDYMHPNQAASIMAATLWLTGKHH